MKNGEGISVSCQCKGGYDMQRNVIRKHGLKKKEKFWTRWFHWQGNHKVHKQFKDRLFRFLFEKDKEALLQIYNALNGTHYEDASQLQVVTIENAVYIVMKNDLAFVLAGTMNLYEHQSTYNPNMPVRFLIYLAAEYQKVVQEAEKSLYGARQIMLPTPQCVVFYNGEKDMPEEQILRLSDAFENKNQEADVEVKVRMLNINYGHNKELMERCSVLEEYAQFIAISREYVAEGMNRQEALNMAISYCVEHGILAKFLRKNRSEVVGMLLEEFDVDKYERSLREEGYEEGIEQAEQRINKLIILLTEQNRTDDLVRAAKDKEYQEKLFHEYNL